MAPTDLIGLRVANLRLWLDARATGIGMTVPGCHARFLAPGPPDDGLVLQVHSGPPPTTNGWRSLFHQPDAWGLWIDDLERYVFVLAERSPPRRHVIVDAGFRRGEVVTAGAGHDRAGRAPYPLENIEIILFVNWLAGFGDVIVHAAGMELSGSGFCFAGGSGSGKSTLAAALASSGLGTVLGEDQVILRYVEGQFWMYGTPWHLDPSMCSPRGVPLEKLFFLDRAAGEGVEPLAPSDGVARLLQTAFIPYYRSEAVAAILDRLALLAEEVPFYTLSYELGTDVRGLIRDG